MHFYFAYGSNMNPARVRGRNMPFTDAISGSLAGWRLVFNKRSIRHVGAASANVEQGDPEDRVEGVIYRLQDEHSILAMDPFEGYPVRYRRELLSVMTETGLVSAWTYVANDDHIGQGLKPAHWYLQHLLAGQPYLSAEYVERLRQVTCLPDTFEEPV